MGTNDLASHPVAKVQDVIGAFRPTRLFKAPAGTSYTSIDFDDSGEFLLLSRTDATIQLFNTWAGAHAKELKSQKYGSALARFTHHSTSIIYASTTVDDGIRYLSMHDNSFIRYFRGHTDRVTSLSMSPSDDKFLSASLDNTVKIWDCRSSNAQGSLNFESAWLTAFDPSASVIAIASPLAQTVSLYDMRNYDKLPFATWDLLATERRLQQSHGQTPGAGWTGMEFSNNGKFLLLATNGPGHYILDAFSGDLLHYAHRPNGSDPSHYAPGDDLPSAPAGSNGSSGNITPTYIQSSACFSPDGRYVVGGNGTQTGLLVWDAMGQATTKGGEEGSITAPMTDLPGPRHAKVVAYNPRHNLLASADRDVVMWLPDPDMI
ncbi:histone H3 methyltransferase complex and RNA cleavage factor II complex, subunit SWD2 [Dissoconium aciculare CBS 342.82]|jgi:COMPASS component SWD2|uniref:Histone H3 methyltransferase complex and RNA cleavage factor II complex, subunit SWD2 n=1 Tax=Dissoconium aciculare CBS 342.82 TaxID=1314786 RepID=A0A6J3MFZ2_9PEZI|nr:histone H3 methyltransferase complex and RNA cleavage factor II complex, subunit SWD2 [Dissoconium aciculare CBS 342.82]KAF1826901.1 histone H3 methyltransferase complex and RNA cleavage factor II complex, subunit SWD2 [Dissoconium aciculare CBS 342.82]